MSWYDPRNRWDPTGEGLQMGILAHLDELRIRLMRSAVALVIGVVIAFFFAGHLADYMRQPYCQIVPDECRLNLLSPTEGVLVYFRVALMLGAAIVIPYITYQVMLFVLPGLTRKERRFVWSSLPAIALLFIAGALFAWFILIPPALGFLEQFQAEVFNTEWTADLYFSFITALVFWMGVAFETPLVFFVLSLLGLVTARAMLRQWRVAIVASAVLAAIITPTIDPVNMLLVMGPLFVLFLFSVVLVAIGSRISRRAVQAVA
jgi:sec-independent protein translocase protein TatC